uniref:Uncharacterized protein n=1 Tax=Kalanchoe fedtschenkoi TaxID=63787 RepID=A0A7N0ZRB0_KALFE
MASFTVAAALIAVVLMVVSPLLSLPSPLIVNAPSATASKSLPSPFVDLSPDVAPPLFPSPGSVASSSSSSLPTIPSDPSSPNPDEPAAAALAPDYSALAPVPSPALSPGASTPFTFTRLQAVAVAALWGFLCYHSRL